ncbi:hypothetical protein vecB_004 [Escherichia phage VEcB]|uniref:Uncharacterized protein n=1 Tax=Escherichia phage VEcB TaxID=2776821 RepID=A0A7L8ZGE4_9CAUD|nr:hypothetical protein JR328_gp004 [Escherichia phage VEcB]QOI67942.1 hypothetical protein vecB_004 [Escherichia phage VEcB]
MCNDRYILRVSDKSPMFDWRGWWLLAPMQGLTDVEKEAYVYTKEEIEDNLYLTDNIKNDIFECKLKGEEE